MNESDYSKTNVQTVGIDEGDVVKTDGKYIYVVAVVPDADTDEKVVIFHYGTEACGCKYYTMTKKSFCEQVEVNGEWVDKFTRQPQVKITDTHIFKFGRSRLSRSRS